MTTAVAASVLATHLTQKYVDRPGNPVENQPPLYDILHQFFPNLCKYERFIDLLPTLLGFVVLYLVLFRNVDYVKPCHTIAIMMFFRCITVMVTRLPSPICAHVDKVVAIGGNNSCIFSGHVALTILFAYVIYRHAPSYRRPLLAYCIITSLLIAATRSHYTIDIIVAWITVYAIIKAAKY